MAENLKFLNRMISLPTEILYKIFYYLPLKDLMKSRQVCLRWKLIIDGMAGNDSLWNNFCQQDFEQCYLIARQKSKRDISWYNLYRSLSLWPRLKDATEEIDEFASASCLIEEIQSLEVLTNGVIAVHVKGGIEYYDAYSLKPDIYETITGDHARYSENENAIAIQSYNLHLFVICKGVKSKIDEANAMFDNVKLFLLTNTELFFVTMIDEIFVSNVCKNPSSAKLIKQMSDQDGIMGLGYTNGGLNILTYQRKIFRIVNCKDAVYQQSLDSESNLLNILHQYNFLDQLDWRVYFQWMYVLNHTVPEGPLRDIIIIRSYGDIFFVGSNFGVLCIFFAPYLNGELDLFNTEPARQINFMERSDIPVLSTCPILQIDVLEIVNGHMIYVAMPKKVAMLKFTHSFMQSPSWAMLPYEMENA